MSLFFAVSCKQDQKKENIGIEEKKEFAVIFVSDKNVVLKATLEDNNSIESGKKVPKDTIVIFTVTPKNQHYDIGEWSITGGVFLEGGNKGGALAKVKVEADINVSVSSIDKNSEVLAKKVGDISFNMIKIPGVEVARIGREGSGPQPLRYVKLSPFYLCETEVTQELYEACMGTNPSNSKDDPAYDGEDGKKRPVESVSWFDAVKFCNKLTTMLMSHEECVYNIKDEGGQITVRLNLNENEKLVKKGFRLPSEAEWEWAARGGYYQAPQYAGPILSEEELNMDGLTEEEQNAKYLENAAKLKEMMKEYGWLPTNAEKVLHQVKMKKPNPYGLYDMSGNVYEWCYDAFSVDFPEYPDYVRMGEPLPNDVIVEDNPMGGKDGDTFIFRGGSFFCPAPPLISSWASHGECNYRGAASANAFNKFVGFRIACALQN